MNTIYTMGYGRTTKQDFQKRLIDLGKETGRKVLVADIRKEFSGSRNGQWCSQQGLWVTIQETGLSKHFGILRMPDLANRFGRTKEALGLYGLSLNINPRDVFVRIAFHKLIYELRDRCQVVALLCAERKPFRENGTTPNCHRVILAEKLLKSLGEGWEVKHL